jgi:hypothetical protein
VGEGKCLECPDVRAKRRGERRGVDGKYSGMTGEETAVGSTGTENPVRIVFGEEDANGLACVRGVVVCVWRV